MFCEFGPIDARSHVGCGHWLDANRLAFTRLKAMPPTLKTNVSSGDANVQPDAMTVATLGGSAPRLLDSPLTWDLTDVCGPHLLTRTPNDMDTDLYLVNNPSDTDLGGGTAMTAPTAMPSIAWTFVTWPWSSGRVTAATSFAGSRAAFGERSDVQQQSV